MTIQMGLLQQALKQTDRATSNRIMVVTIRYANITQCLQRGRTHNMTA